MEKQKPEIVVGLDIGTTKIAVVVGRKDERGKIEILGVGKGKSRGVVDGVVQNILLATESIQTVTEKAEQISGEKIERVYVGIAGQHIKSLQKRENIIRDNPEDVINQEEIKKLVSGIYRVAMQPGEEIIHVLPQDYIVDDQKDIRKPVGMNGTSIEGTFHVVFGKTAHIRNICKCIRGAGLEPAGITLESIASSNSVLSEDEKEMGVALVDIGGGTTDIAIFKEGIIRHTAVVPYGGNIITQDIKNQGIVMEKAEKLKVGFGSALPELESDNEIISIPGLRGREPMLISKKILSQVINSRLKDIFYLVNNEIEEFTRGGDKNKLHCGIVLTGGGSLMKHIKSFVDIETKGHDSRIGFPNEHLSSSVSSSFSSPMYATGIGLVIEGLKHEVNNPRPQEPDPEQETQDSEEELVAEEHKNKESIGLKNVLKTSDKRNIYQKMKETFRGGMDKFLDKVE